MCITVMNIKLEKTDEQKHSTIFKELQIERRKIIKLKKKLEI